MYTMTKTPVIHPDAEVRLRCLEAAIKVKSQSELRIDSKSLLDLASQFEQWIYGNENPMEDSDVQTNR